MIIMRANETRLNKLLAEPDKQFSVPIYQRRYSWTEKQCTTLWEDIIKLSDKEGNAADCRKVVIPLSPGTLLCAGQQCRTVRGRRADTAQKRRFHALAIDADGVKPPLRGEIDVRESAGSRLALFG